MLGRHIAQIARQGAEDSFLEAPSTTVRVEAPPVGQTLMFRYGPLVEGSLTLTNETTGALYTANTDYFEVKEGGFENLSIPEGTPLTAEYFYHDASSAEVALEPAEDWRPVSTQNGWVERSTPPGPPGAYREGSRCWLGGAIEGGPIDAGTVLFSVDLDLAPSYVAWERAASAAGAATLEVRPTGEVAIYDWPSGSITGWLSLEAISWRCREAIVSGPTWQSELTWQTAAAWQS